MTRYIWPEPACNDPRFIEGMAGCRARRQHNYDDRTALVATCLDCGMIRDRTQ